MVKPVPVMEAELTVTGEVPVEVRVTVCVVGESTVTLPKLRFAMLTDNCGFAADETIAVPIPLRATTEVAPVVELLPMVSCPIAAPAAVGWNCTCHVSAWFGFKVTGKPPPTMVKPVPLTEAELIVTGKVPV